jgi:hypothetical protein
MDPFLHFRRINVHSCKKSHKEVLEMQRIKMLAFSLVIAVICAGIFTVRSYAADEGMKATPGSVTGTVICLIPDYKKGTVTPVVATGPCNTLPPHQHIIMTKEGTVYTIQGLQDGLMKVSLMPQRENVTMTGKIEGNNYGWVLLVD